MNKKVILSICIIVIVLIIGIFIWFKLHPTLDKSNPIIFDEQANDSYTNTPEGLTSEYEWNKSSDLDKFYNNEATNEYKDIRELEDDYNKEQAQLDNCFVIGAMVHNEDLYHYFMEKYNNKETAFIRVAQNTVEGDLCLVDVLYDAIENKVKLVRDNTRDEFSAQEDRIIEYKTYEKIGVWNYQNSKFWVAYNGELPDDTGTENSINSNELFIIVKIN